MFRFIVLLYCFITGAFAASVSFHHNHPSLSHALKTGMDSTGKELYLCTAILFNSVQPGKTWAGYGKCNIPYGGREYVVTQFTIPNQQSFGSLVWGQSIQHPLSIGRDSNGNTLYLCQSNLNGSIQPGKTWAGYNHCNISYEGKEVIMHDYKILSTHNEIIIRSRSPRNFHRHS